MKNTFEVRWATLLFRTNLPSSHRCQYSARECTPSPLESQNALMGSDTIPTPYRLSARTPIPKNYSYWPKLKTRIKKCDVSERAIWKMEFLRYKIIRFFSLSLWSLWITGEKCIFFSFISRVHFLLSTKWPRSNSRGNKIETCITWIRNASNKRQFSIIHLVFTELIGCN